MNHACHTLDTPLYWLVHLGTGVSTRVLAGQRGFQLN